MRVTADSERAEIRAWRKEQGKARRERQARRMAKMAYSAMGEDS